MVLFLTAMASSAAFAQIADERLVQSSYQEKTDDLGNTWKFEQNGILGRSTGSNLNNSLQLYIGQNQFSNYQPMVNADGEYVLRGQQPLAGLTITRRLRLFEKTGILRVLDHYQNPSGVDVTTTVSLRNSFSNRSGAKMTNLGRPSPMMLRNRETGIALLPGASGSSKTHLFCLTGPQAKTQVTFKKQSSYQSNLEMRITVPAGGSASVVYTVAQVVAPATPDTTWLKNAFRPLAIQRNLDGLPRELRQSIVNANATGSGAGIGLLIGSSIEALDIEPGPRDVLAMGEESRLVGRADCDSILVKTSHGESEIPFARVAALVGLNGGQNSESRIFLRDGQVVSGQFSAPGGFRFHLPSGGRLEIDADRLDRLVCARVAGADDEDNDSDPLKLSPAAPDIMPWPEGSDALIETMAGERFALGDSGDGAKLDVATSWGLMTIKLEEILWIGPSDNGHVGMKIALKDGTEVATFLQGGTTLKASTSLFGDIEVEPSEIRALLSREAYEVEVASLTDTSRQMFFSGSETSATSQNALPTLTLVGEQKLVGRITLPELVLIGPTGAVSVSPDTIRALVVHDGRSKKSNSALDSLAGTPFQIELWGGGNLIGAFRDPYLPVRIRDSVWQIPVSHIEAVHTPAPRVPDSVRDEIAGLIRALGDDSWRKREESAAELADFGLLARPQLVEARASSGDPEVRRRCDSLLKIVDTAE